MAKKVQTEETVDDSFSGFQFLNGTPAKKTETKEETTEVKDDELSEEEIKALEEEQKLLKDKKDSKSKTSKEEKSEEVEEELEEDPKEEKEDSSFSAWADFLAEKGLLEKEETDKVESEEDLEKLQEKTIKKRVDAYKESLPEDGRKFLEFVENGGNPADFHKYYYGDASFEDFKLDSDDDKKYIIKEGLKAEGYTDEEIADEIQLFEDAGKLETKAKTHLNKLQKIEKQQKELLLETQKQYSIEQEQKRQLEWDNFKKGLFEKEAIGGFKITPKVKDDLWNYMTKIVDRKTGETQYQKDSNQNEDARYVFAYLLKNKWDVKSLERMVENKKVSELNKKLSNFTDSRNKLAKTPKSDIQKELDDNPFAGFSKIL